MWGLQSLRGDKYVAAKLNFVQAQMFRRMMKIKRIKNDQGVVESWLDWHKRSLARAYDTIKAQGILIENVIDNSRVTWSQHVSQGFHLDAS